jgi:hypothetical protein
VNGFKVAFGIGGSDETGSSEKLVRDMLAKLPHDSAVASNATAALEALPRKKEQRTKV